MTKLLIARGKYANLYFDISTPEQEQRAWLALAGFHMSQMFYSLIPDDDLDQKDALAGARAGDWQAAKWLCEMRDQYEYEEWSIEHTVSDSQIDKWIGGLQ